MEDQIAALIIARLDEIKNDANRNSDRLVQSQRALYDKFDAHEKSDAAQFESIRMAVATAKTESDDAASNTAKFWAFVGSVLSLVLGGVLGIFGDWLLFGRKG